MPVFAVDPAGSCSFCGEAATGERTVVGVEGRPWRVCSACVERHSEAIAGRFASTPMSSGHDHVDRWLAQAAKNDALRRESGVADDQIAELRAHEQAMADAMALRDRKAYGDWAVGTVRHPSLERMRQQRCSFCDVSLLDRRLVWPGPRVYICRGCIDALATTV